MRLPERINKFKQDNTQNLQYLKEEFNLGLVHIDALYNLAKFQFEYGYYRKALDNLNNYRSLAPPKYNQIKLLSALWGKLCLDLLLKNWDSAYKDITQLKEAIDANFSTKPINLRIQKLWLLHWSLFAFSHQEGGQVRLLDLFFQD